MAINTAKNNKAYGLSNSLQGLSPQPVISTRNPGVNDKAELGTLWVNTATDAYYVLTSVSGASTWTAQVNGSSSVAALTVTGTSGTVLSVASGGDTVLGGDLAVSGPVVLASNLTVNGNFVANGDYDISSASAVSITSTANQDPSVSFFTNGGTTETMLLQVLQGTSLDSLQLVSNNGGVNIAANNLANADAITIDAGAGGINLSGVLTSQFSVVGAGADLEFGSTGGSINMTATEAVSGAVTITASNAAGTLVLQGVGGASLSATNSTVAVQSGTGALNIGTSAAANVITVGNSTGGSSVVVNSGTGGISVGTNAIAQPITIGNSTGATAVTVNSGTGGVGIGTNAIAQTVTIGNATGASAVTLNAGTGGVNVGTNAIAHTVTVGNGTGATAVTLNAGSGGVNVGTNAIAHTVTIGNNTGASAVSIQAGTAGAGSINIGTTANSVPVNIGNSTSGSSVVLTTPNGSPVLVASGRLSLDGVLVMSGSGSPNTVITAPVGSLFCRIDPAGATSRLYVNTNGTTAWTNVTCAA